MDCKEKVKARQNSGKGADCKEKVKEEGSAGKEENVKRQRSFGKEDFYENEVKRRRNAGQWRKITRGGQPATRANASSYGRSGRQVASEGKRQVVPEGKTTTADGNRRQKKW